MWDFNIDPVRLKVGETQRTLALLNTVMNNCLKVLLLLMTKSKVALNVKEKKLVVLLKISQAILVKNIHIQRGSINMHAWVVKGPDSIEGKKSICKAC